MKYAAKTRVPVARSKDQIEQTLRRYGATGFIFGESEDQAVIGFSMAERQVRFFLPLGDLSEQETRQRWRALLLTIKSKLESVECGIEEFDDAFMAHIVLPQGDTMGTWAKPQIKASYETGDMPALLPPPE